MCDYLIVLHDEAYMAELGVLVMLAPGQDVRCLSFEDAEGGGFHFSPASQRPKRRAVAGKNMQDDPPSGGFVDVVDGVSILDQVEAGVEAAIVTHIIPFLGL